MLLSTIERRHNIKYRSMPSNNVSKDSSGVHGLPHNFVLLHLAAGNYVTRVTATFQFVFLQKFSEAQFHGCICCLQQ